MSFNPVTDMPDLAKGVPKLTSNGLDVKSTVMGLVFGQVLLAQSHQDLLDKALTAAMTGDDSLDTYGVTLTAQIISSAFLANEEVLGAVLAEVGVESTDDLFEPEDLNKVLNKMDEAISNSESKGSGIIPIGGGGYI